MSRHKKWILLDNYRRKYFIKYFIKKSVLKATKKSQLISNYRRYLSSFYLVKLPNYASVSYSNNRCVVSGRVWGTNKKTLMSRFDMRKEIYNSNLPGFRRASW